LLAVRHGVRLSDASAENFPRYFQEGEVRIITPFRSCQSQYRYVLAVAISLVLALPLLAQGNSPWENAVNVLQLAFTSTIARGLSLVAIVVSGLTFAFGEGGSKRVIAGVLFGVGMAIAAVNFLAWLFPA
jgi:type IV secretion system protein TrbC